MADLPIIFPPAANRNCGATPEFRRQRRESMVRFAKAGWTTPEIARSHSVSNATVNVALHDAGLAPIGHVDERGITIGPARWVPAAEAAAWRKSIGAPAETVCAHPTREEGTSQDPAVASRKLLRAQLGYFIARDRLPTSLPLPAFIAACKSVGLRAPA